MATEKDPFDEIFDDEDTTPVVDDDNLEEEETETEGTEEAGGDAAPSEDDIDYKALYLKEQQRFRSEEGRRRKAEQELDQFRQPRSQQQPTQRPQPADPDEEFLENFRKTYNDDVLKAIELMTTRKSRELMSQFDQQRVDPLNNTVATVLQQAHFGAIAAAHPDWETVADDPVFTAWIEAQPSHRRGAYARIIEQGTPAEVIDLLSEFKESRSKKTTSSTPAKNKAAAVPSRRGALPGAASPAKDDFDAAWDEA